MSERPKIRLYVDHPLGSDQIVPLTPDHAQYLFAVMRLRVGDHVALFNGADGEWRAEILDGNKRSGHMRCIAQTAPLQMPPDLWLCFAPIKKARTDFIVEKAAEMGAARICPVQTDFTNSDRIRQDRLQAHAIEAAEQCGGTYVPQVTALIKLSQILGDWPTDRRLIFADEMRAGRAASQLDTPKAEKWAILIGPEGGFSQPERDRLCGLPFVTPISLGPRILRADTAAVAALALWQSTCGDWA
jgi:16S rRNA (uracil1498-N3)-methyltransferase